MPIYCELSMQHPASVKYVSATGTATARPGSVVLAKMVANQKMKTCRHASSDDESPDSRQERAIPFVFVPIRGKLTAISLVSLTFRKR